MHICVIGPSHLAALRTAEKSGLVNTKGFRIDYMGHRSWVYRTLSFKDGRLHFTSPGARPLADDLKVSIQPSDYDALFFHAAIMRLSRILERKEGAVDLKSYSAGMQKRFAVNLIRSLGGYELLRRIRDSFDGPILVSGKPEHAAPADTDIADTGNGDTELTAKLIGAGLADLGFHFIPQPIETVLNGQYTRREYSVGSVALGETRDHGKEDKLHMNEKYGALVFNDALRTLADLKAEQSAAARAD